MEWFQKTIWLINVQNWIVTQITGVALPELNEAKWHVYMHQLIRPSLAPMMTWCQFSAKPLKGLMLAILELIHGNKFQWNSSRNSFHSRKYINQQISQITKKLGHFQATCYQKFCCPMQFPVTKASCRFAMSLRLRQNGQDFADKNLDCFF